MTKPTINDSALLEPFFSTKESLIPILQFAISGDARTIITREQLEGEAGTDVHLVSGTMFRYENIFTSLGWGISTETLKTKITNSLNNKNKCLLVIDSGGGAVNGMADLCDFISQNKENITAFVKGSACSAAYWLASSCGKIIAEKTSLIGSMGVVINIFDNEKFYENHGIIIKDLVNSDSPNKRPDFKTKEGKDEIVRMLNDLAELFITSVATNRNMDKGAAIKGLEFGGVITGSLAKERGFVDEIGSLDEILKINIKERTRAMDKENVIAAELAAKEQKEVVELQKNMDVETKKARKFEALAEYKEELNNDEFNRFKNGDFDATDIKDYVLDKKCKKTTPINSSINNISVNSLEAKGAIVIDALSLMLGAEKPDADDMSKKLSENGSLKAVIAFNSGLGYSSSHGEFAAAMTTSDFPILLKNAVIRTLDEGFSKVPTTYENIVNVVQHKDFKPLTTAARDSITPNAWKDLVEGGEASQLKSKGSAFKLTREMLINDDLGAFKDIITNFGESARRKINQDVYAFLEARNEYKNYVFADNKALFHADHKNLLKGADSAFSAAALSAAKIAIMRQTDHQGQPIGIAPTTLIVPIELISEAQTLMQSDGTLTINQNSGVKNIFKGAFSLLTDAELQDKTAWYLVAGKCINLGVLAGTGGRPIIEMVKHTAAEGIEYQAVMDYVVYGRKPQLLVKSAGK